MLGPQQRSDFETISSSSVKNRTLLTGLNKQTIHTTIIFEKKKDNIFFLENFIFMLDIIVCCYNSKKLTVAILSTVDEIEVRW